MEDKKASEIKNILLKDGNLKLRKQFINNLSKLTNNDFFEPTKELKGKKLQKSELLHVLNNLYTTRSKYVHKLDSLEKVVQTHGYNKTNFIYDNDDPKFSIYGLVIYTQYIINNYIKSCNLLEFEKLSMEKRTFWYYLCKPCSTILGVET